MMHNEVVRLKRDENCKRHKQQIDEFFKDFLSI